ncbi:MAG: cyclase family protein [Kineosporiaceae bacterium]|nr:cyclase family protein [Kineosporiaceae bacterium]
MTDSLLLALATLTQGRWVDLTHAFTAGIPHYGAFPDEQREVVTTIERDGFLVHRYGHVGQWGTHVDPPSHFIPGGRCLDELPVEDMLLPLIVLDGRARVARDADFVIDVAFVHQHEQRHGRIPDGAFVAFASGWSERWPSTARMQNRDAHGIAHYPGWSVPALQFLVEHRGIRAIGHEQTDTDPGVALSAGRVEAERYLLGADRWQIEMLTNLDQVPPTGAVMLASWPKPLTGSGFPARCVAIVPRPLGGGA